MTELKELKIKALALVTIFTLYICMRRVPAGMVRVPMQQTGSGFDNEWADHQLV